MSSDRRSRPVLWVAATLMIALIAVGVGSTWSYFSDEVSIVGRYVVAIPDDPTPPTPDACAGLTFGQVLVGTPGDDRIVAANGGALIFGLGGNDMLEGGNGKDCLVGGDGNDTLVGGNGKDNMLGGEGDDTLYGGGDDDVVDGGNGKDTMNGGAGTDACYGTRKDQFELCETTSTGSAAPAGADPAVAPDPTPATDVGPTPSPDTVTPSAEPSVDATPEPRPEASLEPSPSSDPPLDVTPQPDPPTGSTPTPDPTPTSGAQPSSPPSADPAQTPEPTSDPTPEPTAPPTSNVAPPTSGSDPVMTRADLRLAKLSSTPTSGVPALISWGLADSLAAVRRYDLQVQRDGGAFKALTPSSTRATSQVVTMQTGHTYAYRVRAVDTSGHAGPWKAVAPRRGLNVPDASGSIAWTGPWSSIALNGYLGGSAHSTGAKGATATLRFDGSGVAWAGPVGPTRGKAKVYIDGRYVTTVDLWSASFHPRRVVFAASVRDGRHTIMIKSLGTAGRSTVNIDSIYVIQPR